MNEGDWKINELIYHTINFYNSIIFIIHFFLYFRSLWKVT